MSKILKYLVILFASLGICFTFNYCYAVDMNLTENNASSSNITSSSRSNTTSTSSTSSTTVSSVSTVPEANLGLSNILSILLIAVGIIIIFLGIAILIKLNQ